MRKKKPWNSHFLDIASEFLSPKLVHERRQIGEADLKNEVDARALFTNGSHRKYGTSCRSFFAVMISLMFSFDLLCRDRILHPKKRMPQPFLREFATWMYYTWKNAIRKLTLKSRANFMKLTIAKILYLWRFMTSRLQMVLIPMSV